MTDTALLEAALADLAASSGGTAELVAVVRRLAAIGHVEAYRRDGAFGFRATPRGLIAHLERVEAKGHG